MVIVDNYTQALSDWKPRVVAMRADRAMPILDTDAPLLHWGIALLRHQDEIVIYGLRQTKAGRKDLVVAKAAEAVLHDQSQWRFLTEAGWSKKHANLKSVADDMVDELSVDWVRCGKRRTLVMVHSEPLLGNGIMLRVASNPVGPFSVAKKVWTIAETKRHRKYFGGQAKAHKHLSPPGQLLISYVVNAHDFWLMAGDASIYRPRFIRYAVCP